MKVTLKRYPYEAAKLLILTKNTRLNVQNEMELKWSRDRVSKELKYIANTIPSSWEFIDYTFKVEGVSRAFTHQFVRNRHGSYAQESMRVTDQSAYGFVMPDKIAIDQAGAAVVDSVNYAIQEGYRQLIDLGHAAEDARCILPTNISTGLYVKFNLRTLSELAKSRTGGRTQSEYQKVINAMIDVVLEVHPWASDFLNDDRGRDYFDELEAFALEAFPDLLERGKLLKIVDKMRKQS